MPPYDHTAEEGVGSWRLAWFDEIGKLVECSDLWGELPDTGRPAPVQLVRSSRPSEFLMLEQDPAAESGGSAYNIDIDIESMQVTPLDCG